MNTRILMIAVAAIFLAGTSFKLFGEKEKTPTVNRNNKERIAFYFTSYGKMPFKSVLVKTEVKPNQFLSTIFEEYGISFEKAQQVAALPDSVFNEKRIRSGNKFAVLYTSINNKLTPQKFIYEKNRVEYYTINFENNASIELSKKPIETVRRVTSGIITSSLYETMIANNANPLLAVELSEIYAWTIDFYRIQENDYFKAIYTEEFVEGQSLGSFEIEASVFKHFSKEKYAFSYQHDSLEDGRRGYYSDEGMSLRRAFLQAPVKYSRISSKFSYNRYHPVTGTNKPHLGTDYAAAHGTPIYATADGKVIAAKYKKYNGNYVKIKHNSVYTTQYLHMSAIAVKNGEYVEQGQVIGYVGSTGLATGPHVCYRFWMNGKQVDPYKQDLPEAKSIEGEQLKIYKKYIKDLKNELDETKLLES